VLTDLEILDARDTNHTEIPERSREGLGGAVPFDPSPRSLPASSL
jgi:hypothetical protein